MMLRRAACIVALIYATLLSLPLASAWSESGHAIIAYLAYKQLPEAKQRELEALIQKHPNWEKDFTPPKNLPNKQEAIKWRIGRIGYWPDVARDYEQYNRPTWHYQLGASMTMGDVSGIPIPMDPTELPSDATMETKELYVLQALELCKRELANKENDPAKRAIALCWIAHLIADLHLPCHSGSLYAESVFADTDGDRGANRIDIGKQPLHSLWDQLLGNDYERGDVNRRIYELTNDPMLVERSKKALDQLDPVVWVQESRAIAVQYVYTAEVQQAIRAAIEAKKKKLPPLRLSNDYAKQAGRIAQVRAVESAARLAAVLKDSL